MGGLGFDSLRGRSAEGVVHRSVRLSVLLTHPPSSGRYHISCDQPRIRYPGALWSYLHRGNPRRFSLNIPSKIVRLKLKKISQSTGPYSPDQDGPPDKTSGVEASCKLLLLSSTLVPTYLPKLHAHERPACALFFTSFLSLERVSKPSYHASLPTHPETTSHARIWYPPRAS